MGFSLSEKMIAGTLIVLSIFFTPDLQAAQRDDSTTIPAIKETKVVSTEEMQQVYNLVKTPFKYGVVLKGEAGIKVDSPSVFRHGDLWYMIYIMFGGRGYETAIASSKDLLEWKPLGKILKFSDGTWDANQAAGYAALQDPLWDGSYQLQKFDGKYWLSYLGGSQTGYERGRLGVGMAWSLDPILPEPWNRLENNPVLSPDQSDVRDFEQSKLFKSHILYDHERSLGYPFVMYYNAKDEHESIGMAVSHDMIDWVRYGADPVIDHGSGISGDPQVVRIGDLWVMFYFGAFWKPNAFDTFACSHDLVHWTPWNGPHLIEPSEPWDRKYAHKPWVVVHNDVVYHFYNAVGDQGRVIALATSKKIQ